MTVPATISKQPNVSPTMKNSRRSSTSSAFQGRSNSMRLHGRVTTEDIRSASLRRWDGKARITTDWINLFHEPELCFSDGDLLIYLREPGQSSHGPAFRVHKAQLKEKGFDFLLDKCINRPPIHPGTDCLMSSCHGCDIHSPPSELYIPAPANSELDFMFDHHITTRNFFAWLYQLPLAGRALGRSLVTLKERIDYYRPSSPANSSIEILSYAETQRYLDFRECVDHALAALLLAECLQVEDLWVDAFAHCVGMGHRGLNTSLEYWAISYETRLLINKAQVQMDKQLASVRTSVCDFFENDLSSNFLGLSQAARDHFDRFRSWLHSYHIEQHGFWPPIGFEDPAVERDIYSIMYADFRNLYHHLVDPNFPSGMTDLHLSASGGVCVAQNIEAFDSRHRYESLPHTMPMLPQEPDLDIKKPGIQRRKSWNPVTRRRVDKDKRKTLRVQALITASNRDWAIMQCPLVRRYSEFESQTITDDSETISIIEGRKLRWILVYAILQTLISVMQTPRQVRNPDGLTYLLCCQPPNPMPWQPYPASRAVPTLQKRQTLIEPDAQYIHSNPAPVESVSGRTSLSLKQLKEKRRRSLPAQIVSTSSRPSTSRSASLKHLIIKRNSVVDDVPPVPKSPGFCEILVQGYGNGLNEIDVNSIGNSNLDSNEEQVPTPRAHPPAAIIATKHLPHAKTEPNSASTDKMPGLSPTSSISVSRESSNASSNSVWSKTSSVHASAIDLTKLSSTQVSAQLSLPDLSKLMLAGKPPSPNLDSRRLSDDLNHVLDEEGFLRTVHFNTETWDDFLGIVH